MRARQISHSSTHAERRMNRMNHHRGMNVLRKDAETSKPH